MKALAQYSFMFIIFAGSAVAAESSAHHEPSIRDLLYPAINFAILLGFLIWKLKTPMRAMFDKKAADVQSLMTSAAQKNKDAEDRLKNFQAKMSKLDSELASIRKDYEADVANFTRNQSNETQSIITRTKKDLESKLEGERNDLIEQMNVDLLNSVIAKTQQTISGNGDFKTRATHKIVSELR